MNTEGHYDSFGSCKFLINSDSLLTITITFHLQSTKLLDGLTVLS